MYPSSVAYDFDMGHLPLPPLRILFWVVIADYAAQVPYYLINYYFPSHLAPTISAVVLLGLTLVWFLIGYFGFRRGKPWGFWVLASFLAVESLFYLLSIVRGSAFVQIQTPDPWIKAVFIVGYVTGLVSAVFLVALLANRKRWRESLT
jgi:hypothetical protein